MNVETLLEAAKFLELQEEQQRQREQQQANVKPPTTQEPQPPQPQQHNHSIQQPQPPSIAAAAAAAVHLQNSIPTLMRTKPDAVSPRHLTNSFDIINPLVIDDAGEPKRKQPPIPFRTGTREVHNKLEKDRRAHLKECFDALKKQLPRAQDERKSSNLSILHSALRYVQALKRKERDLEHEMELLARQKINNQQRLAVLRRDGGAAGEAAAASEAPSAGEAGQAAAAALRVNGIVKEPAPPPAPAAPTTALPVHTTALSVVPVTYPVGQVVLQKVIVPKGLQDALPLVSAAGHHHHHHHFIAPAQPHLAAGGKVVPLQVNAQYVVKPVVVVSTPSRPS